jgi:hypothetical protein
MKKGIFLPVENCEFFPKKDLARLLGWLALI